ncbi:hypothetical protein GH714_034967 [Hevea brasiliensis]|uniref:AT-hook motif nuclear-localized protein n=1 Tax=Hevea brasiliensis TaxID=3981 RepID=A0A6A6MKI8_HEVBR|nr:hypothetical protein GH714_034967 [Hevea brasiliensis]
MSGRESYGGGGERNQSPTITPSSNMNLAFRADEATPVYQPIMPITTDDTLHHLQSIPPHHHEMMLMGCGGIGVGCVIENNVILPKWPRGVCILSANGALSNVTLHQAATLGGAVSYEGRFEILSLSGSFLPSESSGQRSRTGCLSVLLAGPDGRVLGGVAGLLIAASSVQVIVGSFISEDWKESSLGINQPETLYALGALVAGSPTSRGTFSESSGGPVSLLTRALEAAAAIHRACQMCHGNR